MTKKICFFVAGYQTVLIPVTREKKIYSEQTIAAMWNIHLVIWLENQDRQEAKPDFIHKLAIAQKEYNVTDY